MVSAFEKLSYPIQKWVRHEGWQELRQFQADAIHRISDTDSNLIISAPTAGGKTEAVFLPLISQVLDKPVEAGGFDLLYIGPLKALINDQTSRLDNICHHVDLPVYPWHGDVSISKKSKALKKPKGILLITPESLEAVFIRRSTEILRLFGATRAIIIDELHNFLDSERGIQVRSLLTRLSISINRPIRRIGLSATLGDMQIARSYLNPDNPQSVHVIESRGGQTELHLQLRGYEKGNKEETQSVTDKITTHLFKNLRGSNNLVFANSRVEVEIYTDALRMLCEKNHLPEEFYPHHGNLAKGHRELIEKRLKNGNLPTTAVCTSTLELGIDIGEVKCVAQIEAPFSVTAMRQRLGRSGRRKGQPAILRQYNILPRLESNSNYLDRLRTGLIQTIAMIELLLEKWCEPPNPEALHLTTMVHQILSIIAGQGVVSANRLFYILCQEGPFDQVDIKTFLDVLRALGRPETNLIEQTENGLLLLGSKGEKLVEHYSFYAVFKTTEEFRVIAGNQELGTIPINNMLIPGMYLLFSGRRWIIQEIWELEKVILVKPSKAGTLPRFNSNGSGIIHDVIVKKMFELFESNYNPVYMDQTSLRLLNEARQVFSGLNLSSKSIINTEEGTYLLATRCGSVKTNTLALALGSKGFSVEQAAGFLNIKDDNSDQSLMRVLAYLSEGNSIDIFEHSPNLIFEKYHGYLTNDLLQKDALSSRLDVGSLQGICSSLVSAP